MKKLLPVSLIIASIFLVSCGKQNLDNVIITPDTPIEDRDQSAKVCEPVVKYITCSIDKASEEGKKKLQTALKNIQRKIDNDEPSKVAQECDSMIKILVEKAEETSKNGCSISAPTYAEEKSNTTQPAPTPTTTPTTETAQQ